MARRSRAAWAKIVREWRASGKSARLFASRRGLSRHSLQWWASKLRREDGADASRLEFVEIPPPVVEREEARFEVVLANGRRVFVAPRFDEAALARLLVLVEGAR